MNLVINNEGAIFNALKTATHQWHIKIERNSRLAQLVRPDITERRYIEILQRLFGFYLPLEQQIDAFPEWQAYGFERPVKQKTQWLYADLVKMGMTEEQIQTLPICPLETGVTCFYSSLGARYVLEGATLGGQIITRQLHKHLAPDMQGSTRFYSGYGNSTARMWQGFKDFANQLDWNDGHCEQAANAAILTFKNMDIWLSQ